MIAVTHRPSPSNPSQVWENLLDFYRKTNRKYSALLPFPQQQIEGLGVKSLKLKLLGTAFFV